MRIMLAAVMICTLAAPSFAASFHWVDRQGFHSADQVTKVPLAHRKDLPMVKNGASFPFTGEEDRDGAMYVWFILGQAGFDYPFIRGKDFPGSPLFKRVGEPQEGDIAWWQGLVAIYQGEGAKLLTARGELRLKEIEKKRGKASWYRYAGPPRTSKAPTLEKAPQGALKRADEALLRLDGAASFPPQVNDDAERDLLRKEWQKAVATLEALRKRYPDDPQLLRRIGACYRRGYNLGMPGAWERAEAYLLRTEELAPEAPEAYISLGILYADTGPDHAGPAEKQFRKALPHARKEQLAQVWWGLALALYYQGKVRDAVATIDRLIALNPDDARARKLRETFLASER